jgi:hypothetical protein
LSNVSKSVAQNSSAGSRTSLASALSSLTSGRLSSKVSGPVVAGIKFRSTFASARGSSESRASASDVSISARRRS